MSKVLIVEDEIFVVIQAEMALADAGFDVVGAARTPEEAIAKAGALAPDLVLMDINLNAARDGIDVALELREKHDIPCLFASAYIDDATRTRAAATNPIGFISKPYSQDDIARAVDGFKTRSS